MSTETRRLLPRDLPYAPGQILAAGAQFHRLMTLDQLVACWAEHRDTLPYAVTSNATNENWFLESYEWIFAPAIPALIRAVVRWDQFQIATIWYDWAGKRPEEHAAFFQERDQYRARRIAAGAWTHEQEHTFQSDPRTPHTYRGWWELTNLPTRLPADALLGEFPDEITDPCLTLQEVEEKFQVQIFESLKGPYACGNDIETFDRAAVDEHIGYWLDERSCGHDYYGSENEQPSHRGPVRGR
jgi:hypothetical protein